MKNHNEREKHHYAEEPILQHSILKLGHTHQVWFSPCSLSFHYFTAWLQHIVHRFSASDITTDENNQLSLKHYLNYLIDAFILGNVTTCGKTDYLPDYSVSSHTFTSCNISNSSTPPDVCYRTSRSHLQSYCMLTQTQGPLTLIIAKLSPVL